MENFDENIENEYRKRFNDFEETPDDLLWKNIEARIRPEKKRPLVIWWNSLPSPIGIAASLLIGVAVGAYFLIKTENAKAVTESPEKLENSKGKIEQIKTKKEHQSIEKQPGLLAKKTDAFGNKAKQNEIIEGQKTVKREEVNPVHEEDELGSVALMKENKSDSLPQFKAENKSTLIVNNTPEVTTGKPVEVIEQKVIEEKAIVKIEEKEPEVNRLPEMVGEIKQAIDTLEKPMLPVIVAIKEEEIEMWKDTLFRDIKVLAGKEPLGLAVVPKQTHLPEFPEPEIPVIAVIEKNRRVFIPPTEIFANVTSSLSYYMFSPNKADQVLVSNFSNGSQRFGFTAQLGFVYPIAKKMDLRTGLSYFTRKSRISYGVLDESNKSITVLSDNSIQISPGSSFKNENRNWQYFELQSDVLYEVKSMHAVSLGMKLGVQASALNSPLVQARVGYRISRPVADHWALWLEPAISISLSNHQSLENLFMYRTTGFGLNMGVSLLR